MSKPSIVRFALSCGALVRVTIVVERTNCRCPKKHRPTARQIAGDVWLALQDDDARAATRGAEGGDHA